MERSLRVLAVDPFHGGSHRAFLDGLIAHSRHQWLSVKGKAVHWKWRMRSAPLELAAAARKEIDAHGYPDVVFCSDMLDLPQWRGMLRDDLILNAPTAVYFHENQWTYPVSPQARVDLHYGYTNLLTALAADACWFNSAFHRDDFLCAARRFVARMPDAHQAHDFESLQRKCAVIPPGFVAPTSLAPRTDQRRLTIGWVSRWEHDKRPDRLVDLLAILLDRGVDFQLVLLGPRSRDTSDPLQWIGDRLADRIVYNRFAETRQEYWSRLRQIDVVVSTADHEFFGIAICEAIWAGAVPVLPNRLSYPELVPSEYLYDTLDDAAECLASLQDPQLRKARSIQSRAAIEPMRIERTVIEIDEAIERLDCPS